MSAVQINFAGEEELRELPGVGARVARNIVRFREENFPITPANIHDIHKLKDIKKITRAHRFYRPACTHRRQQSAYISNAGIFCTGPAQFYE